MAVAKYIAAPCPACSYASKNLISKIQEKYEVIEYDLRFDRNERAVKIWSQITNKIPTIMVEGKSRTNWFVGVDSIERLAERCEGWGEVRMTKRRTKAPVELPPKIIDNYDVVESRKPKTDSVIDTRGVIV